MTNANHELQTDHAWENRRLILASLAPRTATRPARRGIVDGAEDTTGDIEPKKPGLLTRALHASGRVARAGGHQFSKRVPPDRRMHTAIITAAAAAVLLVALAGVNYLNSDVHPQANTTTSATTAPPPTQAPLRQDTIIKGVTATDVCPRDANYSEANRAFDGDFNTAWVCTRVKNQDGQTIQVTFDRQVTLTQIRAIGGFDTDPTAPGGDQWSRHRIVTQLEVWFPKDLKRDPATIDTGGARDWRFITLNPPATVSKLLFRIKETAEPPQPATPTNQPESPNADDATTVAISEIQFIGTENPHAT